ncbi:MAG: helicase-associated domain-containing protein [Firmicutes bacterium]|nr:helicase-associated domain-containing protein [Bacillota bacterium]
MTTLSSCLMALPRSGQEDLAKRLGVDSSLKSSSLVQTLSEAYASREGFERVWASLSPQEQQVYRETIVQMHSDGYMLGVSRAHVLLALEPSGIPEEHVITLLNRLITMGLLQYTQIWYIGDGYEVPQELVQLAIQTCLFAALDPVSIAAEPVKVTFSFGRMFRGDVVRLAARIAREPLAITQRRILYKRDMARVLPCLRVNDVEGLTLRGDLKETPFGLFLTLRVLELASVITYLDGRVVVLKEGLLRLVRADEVAWETMVEAATRSFEQAGHLFVIGAYRKCVADLDTGRWYALDAAFQRLLQVSTDLSIPTWLESVRLFGRLLAVAGEVEIGEHPVHGEVIRRRRHATADVAPASTWVIQPNLEMLVPESAPAVLHLLAGQFGEIIRADEMSIYRLTKPGILQLCDRGWTFTDLTDALSRFSHAPLAPGVLRTLRDWTQEYNRAVLWDVLLVRFESEALLARFLEDPRGQSAVCEQIGPLALSIARQSEKRVREWLAEMGAPAPTRVRHANGEGDVSNWTAGGQKKGSTPGCKTSALSAADLLPLVREWSPEEQADTGTS